MLIFFNSYLLNVAWKFISVATSVTEVLPFLFFLLYIYRQIIYVHIIRHRYLLIDKFICDFARKREISNTPETDDECLKLDYARLVCRQLHEAGQYLSWIHGISNFVYIFGELVFYTVKIFGILKYDYLIQAMILNLLLVVMRLSVLIWLMSTTSKTEKQVNCMM